MYSSFCKFEIWIGFKSFSSNSLYCANNCFLDLFKHTIAVYVIAVNGWKCFKSHTLSNSDLFGIEKDNSLKSSVSTIYQTFDGVDLYPSIEEKAANLLYFITKNHSFVDGNKRIAAFLFLYFLERNGILYDSSGNKRIADNALVALTLMIAVSKPEEKDTMIKVIVNLINRRN